MKSRDALLRRYIREAIDLGKIQFAPDRVDPVGRERNTPDEQKLYNDLKNRITLGTELSKDSAGKIVDLLGSKYGEIEGGSRFFTEPPLNQLLFRGHSVDKNWVNTYVSKVDIKRLQGMSPADDEEGFAVHEAEAILTDQINSNNLIKLKKPYYFRQLRGWSKDMKAAIGFAITYASERSPDPINEDDADAGNPVVFVTTASTSDTAWLDLENNMYKTRAAGEMTVEKECVNLGTVTVTHVAIVLREDQGNEE